MTNHPTKFSFVAAASFAAALLFLCQVQVASAEIIPDDRVAPWQGNVGVPGGIPNRTIIYKNIVSDLGADPTGVHDVSAIIANAIRTCPTNQVVYIPEGTFRLEHFVYLPYKGNFTVRGAGQGRTIIKQVGGLSSAFLLGNSGYLVNDTPLVPITAGATKGSNTITVGNTSSFAVGELMTIVAGSTPTWAHRLVNPPSTDATVPIMCTFRIASKTSTTVTFNPSCPFDFSALSPKAQPFLLWPGKPETSMKSIGVESMTFDLSQSTSFCAIQWQLTWGCWVKDIEIKGAYSRLMVFSGFNRGEIRGCHAHDHQGTSGPGQEGFDFTDHCSWNLVEDNIMGPHGGAPAIILGDGGGGASCNVIAYNYCFGNSDTGYYDISLNHGAHNFLNLVEENVIEVYQDDGYFGSCSHNTLFRNKISNQLRLKHMSTYYSVVGNVLGNGQQTLYETDVPNYWQTGFPIYELGYPNAGNTIYTDTFGPTDPPDYSGLSLYLTNPDNQKLDLNVKATLIRHGNFDTVHNGVVWDDNISDHNIPPSLYYSGTPSWWPEGVAWPPIGPDLTPMTSQIPAQIKYATISAPGPGGLRILP